MKFEMLTGADVSKMRERAIEASALLRLLANPNRLLIVCLLVEGERSVAELETVLGIRQPSLSQQLAELREASLLTSRREAKSVYYRLSENRATAVVDVLHRIFCDPQSTSSMVNGPRAAVSPERLPSRRRNSEAASFAVVQGRS